jgi:hypothetical protein
MKALRADMVSGILIIVVILCLSACSDEARIPGLNELLHPADSVWDWRPVFEDTFSGSSVDSSRWGKAWDVTFFSLSDGRMTTEKGYSWMKAPPMSNYAVEFDFIKQDQTDRDSYLRLQFRTPESLGHNPYLYMVIFRPVGIFYYDPQSETGGKLSDLGTNVGDPPLYVRVEVLDGWITVSTKTSSGALFDQQGDPLYVDALLGQPTHMCFYDYQVKTSVDNVRVYAEWQDM